MTGPQKTCAFGCAAPVVQRVRFLDGWISVCADCRRDLTPWPLRARVAGALVLLAALAAAGWWGLA